MKRHLLLAFVVLLSCSAVAQRSITTFALTDTVFTVGSVYTGCVVWYDLDGHSYVRDESKPCLDTLADFILAHPGIVIEIGSHTDQRGSDSSNLKLSQGRAIRVKEYLWTRGVPRYALAAVGYGETQPVVKEEVIKTKTDKAERENLYQQNRRTEFKILVLPGNVFTLTDTVFHEGSIFRSDWILFDLGKATLRPEAFPILDSLALLLLAHPDLVMEVGVHTDTRVSDKSSQKLSMARAKTITDYLISKGVPREQVIGKGYEGTKPLFSDAEIKKRPYKGGKEELHQLNRRTEIKIVKINPQ